jgi:glycosyltransferase involved in cell wall biosynthesis
MVNKAVFSGENSNEHLLTEEDVLIDVSVVVTTYNRQRLLRECIKSLFNQDLHPSRYEIIVVDDGSNDGTSEMLRHMCAPCNFVIITQPHNVGQTASKNAGANRARGRILLFIDDDMQCNSRLLTDHLTSHKRKSSEGVIFGPIRATTVASGDFASILLKESLDEKFDRLNAEPTPLWPDDASLMPNSSLPRRLFLRHRGFDAINFGRRREDEEFGVRLWKGSVPFTFEPSALACHFWEKNSAQMRPNWKEEGAALVRLYRKHPELRGTRPTFAKLLKSPLWSQYAVLLLALYPWLAAGFIQVILSTFSSFGKSAYPVPYKLLSVQRALFVLHGSYNEAGSWQKFRRLFGSYSVDHVNVFRL